MMDDRRVQPIRLTASVTETSRERPLNLMPGCRHQGEPSGHFPSSSKVLRSALDKCAASHCKKSQLPFFLVGKSCKSAFAKASVAAQSS